MLPVDAVVDVDAADDGSVRGIGVRVTGILATAAAVVVVDDCCW